MRKILSAFLLSWWQPMLLYFIAVTVFILMSWNNYGTVVSFIGIICIIALSLLFVSGIFLLWKREWLRAIVPLSVFALSICAIILFFLTGVILQGVLDGDGFARGLKIPDGIEIGEPQRLLVDNFRPDSIVKLSRKKSDFQLYSSFQPGLYEYDFWTGKLDSGKIYLKVFEISKEYALSENRLRESTAIEVFNPADSIIRFATRQYFTIYEGDWGDPYAARFEVWYAPGDGDEHRKLFSKNYKIEGWMH